MKKLGRQFALAALNIYAVAFVQNCDGGTSGVSSWGRKPERGDRSRVSSPVVGTDGRELVCPYDYDHREIMHDGGSTFVRAPVMDE